MGTRAQFFIGNPQSPDAKWLGCVAFDGYPDGDIGEALRLVTSEDEFRAAIQAIKTDRDDFCDPAERRFPFPWRDDLFLTDFTYAFFDNQVMATCFHHGWRLLKSFETEDGPYPEDAPDELPSNVLFRFDDATNPPGPDSIMIIAAGR